MVMHYKALDTRILAAAILILKGHGADHAVVRNGLNSIRTVGRTSGTRLSKLAYFIS